MNGPAFKLEFFKYSLVAWPVSGPRRLPVLLRQRHRGQARAGLQDDVLIAVVGPGAHAVTAALGTSTSARVSPVALSTANQHGRILTVGVGVQQHVGRDRHRHRLPEPVLPISSPATAGLFSTRLGVWPAGDHPGVLTAVHVDSGDAAVRRLVQRDVRRMPWRAAAGPVSILRERGAGRRLVLQVRFFAGHELDRTAGGTARRYTEYRYPDQLPRAK